MSAAKLLRVVGAQIRANRVDLGLTQRELGERAGIVDKYVSEIERGTRDVPLSTLRAIVERGLDLRLEILFRHAGEDARDIPPRIEDVWWMLAKLPVERQTKIVEIMRVMVDLAQ